MSDEDYLPSQTQVSGQSEEELTCEIAKCLLTLDHSKRIIKQSEIWSMLSTRPSRKKWPDLLKKACKHLQALGLDVIDCHKSYIIVQQTTSIPGLHMLLTREEKADRTLLFLILAFLFMKEGTVTEVELLHHLELLHIYNKSCVTHSYFGNVQSKLGEFTDMGYLVREQHKDQGDTVDMSWGPRAEAELNKKDVLEFVCEVAYRGKCKPSDWLSQYEQCAKGEDAGQTTMQTDSDN